MILIEYLNSNMTAVWSIIVVGFSVDAFFITKAIISVIRKKRNKLSNQKVKIIKEIVYVNKYLDSDLTELKHLENKKFYYEAKDKDFFAKRASFFLNLLDIRGYLNRRMRRKHPDKVVLIRMEMNNGQFKEFLVAEDEKDGFKHSGKKYIFDLDARYYVINSNIWAYDFHESLTVPVKRTIPVNEIKSTMEHSDITEVENAINPVTLERFIKSEIAQGILQGATIGRLFKVMLILLIIILVISAIGLLIGLYDSGVIQTLIEQANTK